MKEKEYRKSPFLKSQFLSITAIALIAFSQSGWGPAGAAGPADAAATLSGVVKFQGIAPKPKAIDMSSDPNCAKAHPTPATTEEVVVGADNGLANVIVYVSDGLGDRTFQPPDQPVVLEQKGCEYRPHVLALQTKQKLDVVNADETTHNIHPSPNNNREWNMTQPHGMPLEQAFAREEIAIPVKCNIHPWMKGYIAVFKHPYFVVSDKKGSFDLKDLPPGSYTITAWHEKLGMLTQKITVGAGETKTLDFTFKQ
jgi:plastocyanin